MKLYTPTPKKIKDDCAEIRATWSPRTKEKRAGTAKKIIWLPPYVDLSVIDEILLEFEESEANLRIQ